MAPPVCWVGNGGRVGVSASWGIWAGGWKGFLSLWQLLNAESEAAIKIHLWQGMFLWLFLLSCCSTVVPMLGHSFWLQVASEVCTYI